MQFFGPKSICFGNFPTFFVTTMTGHQKDNIFVLTSLHGCLQKNGFGPKTAFLDPKRATLGNRGHETGRQPAKRPPTGKLKVSRVTSGYGGLMIPLSRVRLTQKNGGYIGVTLKNADFRAKIGPQRPPRGPPCNGINTKMLSFCCPVMMVTKKLDAFGKKMEKNETPIFSVQTVTTQWDHKSPIS